MCAQCKSLLSPGTLACPTDGGPAEDVETLPAGARLGAYKIVRVLGEGGMGFVYEAVHEVLHRRTAIKMLRPELASPEVIVRFLQEAKAVNLIDHQNIINVYDYSDGADGSVYFVMEYLEGETLDDLMWRNRPMPLPLLLHTFTQTARALAAAHAKKIVHRDLKPANVFVIAREGNPAFIKLLDFGIAQLRGEGAVSGLTAAGTVMGTPQYMSPEQITGGAVDARTDVWALGVMLYRAATGQAPFRGEGFAQLAATISLDTPPTPRSLVPEIPDGLDQLIQRCLVHELDGRVQSMAELLAGLDRVQATARLTEEAILAAINTAPAPSSLPPTADRSVAGSLPEFQGVDPHAVRPRPVAPAPAPAPVPATPAPRRKTGLHVGLGAGAVALAVGAVVLGGAAPAPAPAPAPPVIAAVGSAGSAPAPTPAVSPQAAAAAALRDAIASGNLQQQGQAVDAIALVRGQRAAVHLYAALKGAPDVRVKAARALGALAIPDAAPKVRAALAGSGDKLRVELAAVLLGLGDKDARVILERAVSDPGMRLIAAVALAEAGAADRARPTLAEIAEATPVGRDQWRRASYGLARLGDAPARAALAAELAQPDPVRALGAAELLVQLAAPPAPPDPAARAYLQRVVIDPEFVHRGEAALALARLGDAAGLPWVPTGLASADADERKLAIAVCAALADRTHTSAITALATDDLDRAVRLTAAAALL